MAEARVRELCLVNLGTPAEPTPKAIRAFLREFLSDPDVVDPQGLVWRLVLNGIILPRRPRAIAPAYRAIWTKEGSPLAVQTEALAAALSEHVARPVDVAYRYGPRSIARTVERAGSLTLLPLFPQRTSSTTGSIESELARVLARSEDADVELSLIAPDDPGYVRALADRARASFEEHGEPEHLLVSFHGIPVRYDEREGRRYSRDCALTEGALLEELGWPRERATLAYQSRFGREPWLEPATADVLEELPARGVRALAVTAPGFVTDGLETLEELGLRGRESFEEAGGERFALVPAVADHPDFVEALARVAAGPTT